MLVLLYSQCKRWGLQHGCHVLKDTSARQGEQDVWQQICHTEQPRLLHLPRLSARLCNFNVLLTLGSYVIFMLFP